MRHRPYPGSARRAPGNTESMEAATELFLQDIPSRILGSYPISRWGLSQGLAQTAARWQSRLASGLMSELEMRASIIPTAHLASAMLEGYLRGTPIHLRSAAFERLCWESDRVLTGRPQAVLLQSGIE